MIDKLHHLSPETLYRIGNIGLILVQALLFLTANFLAIFSEQWGSLPAEKAAVHVAVCVFLIYRLFFPVFHICLRQGYETCVADYWSTYRGGRGGVSSCI